VESFALIDRWCVTGIASIDYRFEETLVKRHEQRRRAQARAVAGNIVCVIDATNGQAHRPRQSGGSRRGATDPSCPEVLMARLDSEQGRGQRPRATCAYV